MQLYVQAWLLDKDGNRFLYYGCETGSKGASITI